MVVYLYADLFSPTMGSQIIVYLFGSMILLKMLEYLLFDLPAKMRVRSLRRNVKGADPYTLTRLFKIINKFSENESFDETYNFEGIYVLYNQTKKKYFVGSSENVMDSLMLHLVGEGYSNIYDDVKSGDEFNVKFLPINDTQSDDIEDLWYTGVKAFKSNSKRRGYN